jgi:hypothetical protein
VPATAGSSAAERQPNKIFGDELFVAGLAGRCMVYEADPDVTALLDGQRRDAAGDDVATEPRFEDRDMDGQLALPVPAQDPVDVRRRVAEGLRQRQQAVRGRGGLIAPLLL